jgi:nicotinamidase-related amidase
MGEQALILIDVQQGFSDLAWGVRNNPNFERNLQQLLEKWRLRNWPVIHVRHNSREELSPLAPGQFGNAFMDFAMPRKGEEIIEKTVNSAFIGTDLQYILTKRRISNLAFAGLTTDHCVSTTTRMAANLGFSAVVFSDATATFPRLDYDGSLIEAELVHRVALASLDREFAKVVTLSSFFGQ